MRIAVVLAVSLAGAAALRAQTPTTVTATVVDPNAIPYGSGATVKAQLVPSPPGGPCVVTGGNCVPVPGTAGPIQLASNGSFTMSLYGNNIIQPSGTQWSFTVCISPGVFAPWGTGPQCFTVAQSISGSSQDISTALKAAALALTVTPTFPGGITSWANITSGTNTHTGAFVSTAGNYNFSGISLFQLPAQPAFTTSNVGQIGFDTTNSNWHVNLNTSDAILAPFAATPTNGDCISAGNSSGKLTLVDTGSPCAAAPPTPVRTGIVLASYTQTQAANIALTSTDVFQTILSQTVVFPPSCPCQVRIHWNLYPTGGGGTPSFSAGVEDGSGAGNLIAASQNASGGNTGGMSSSQLSTQTYTGSVNFSLVVANSSSPASSSINANPLILPAGYGAPGFLNVEVVQPASDGLDQAITQTALLASSMSIGPVTPTSLNEIPIALIVGDTTSLTPVFSPGVGSTLLAGAPPAAVFTGTIATPTKVNVSNSQTTNMAAVLALLNLSGAFSSVQVSTTSSGALSGTASVSFGSNVTANNAILAVISAGNAPATQTQIQVTDSEGNTFLPIATVYLSSSVRHSIQGTMFLATHVVGGTADTVHVHILGGATLLDGTVQAFELTGIL